jgi:hypothetical protein
MYKSIIAMWGIVLAVVVAAYGASSCEQFFTIYGKTKGDHGVLLWDVYVDGECEHYTSYCLFLGNDQPTLMTVGGSAKSVFPQFLSEHHSEKAIVLTAIDGKCSIKRGISVAPPASDSTFSRKFNKVIGDGGRNAYDWYKKCPVYCSDYPEFMGVDAKLVYQHVGGLYKNYSFSQVLYFPQSRYLVLVTNQPLRAAGLDSMHGLLVYRLLKKEVSR